MATVKSKQFSQEIRRQGKSVRRDIGQNEPFCLLSRTVPLDFQRVKLVPSTPTSDKTMNDRRELVKALAMPKGQ